MLFNITNFNAAISASFCFGHSSGTGPSCGEGGGNAVFQYRCYSIDSGYGGYGGGRHLAGWRGDYRDQTYYRPEGHIYSHPTPGYSHPTPGYSHPTPGYGGKRTDDKLVSDVCVYTLFTNDRKQELREGPCFPFHEEVRS